MKAIDLRTNQDLHHILSLSFEDVKNLSKSDLFNVIVLFSPHPQSPSQ